MPRRIIKGSLAALGILLLILDARTALTGASEGVALCLQTVIPSLLPFFILSILLTASLTGVRMPILRPIERLCGIPEGGGSLLLVGLLGGYPVGAQCVAQAYQNGQLDAGNARRLLGFCSNAGPAFLFGMVAGKFSHAWMGWALWGIHILSAITVGTILPGRQRANVELKPGPDVSMETALKKAITVMTGVCGWVILLRVIIAFLDRWFLWLLSDEMRTVFCGLLELANGCCDLEVITNPGLRFVVAAGILGFGGISVLMQTMSVTAQLGLGQYLPGRLLHCMISVLLAFLCQRSSLPAGENLAVSVWLLLPIFGLLIAIFLRKGKIKSRNLSAVGV